jgi:hypothetical protein
MLGEGSVATSTPFFAPGETTKTITIDVKGDAKTEANETFTKHRGLGTILNDDGRRMRSACAWTATRDFSEGNTPSGQSRIK